MIARWTENLCLDLRSGYRGLRRSPLFAATVVLTLALGIGATAALFGVVDAVLLRPLAGRGSERLVWLQEYGDNHEASGGTPSRFADWQRAHSFSSMCGIYTDRAVFLGEDGPVNLRLLHAIGDAYGTLAPALLMGRAFTAKENRGEGQPVALVAARTWRERLGGGSDILKRTIRLGNAEYQVVGVLDSAAVGVNEFPEGVDVWVAMTADLARAPRQSGFLGEIGRLKPGASIAGAQAEINLLTSQLAKTYPATDKDRSALLVPLQEYVSHEAETPLLTLLAAAGAVLLIACVNIAGLLVTRGLARQREAAIRISVGAGFFRLARLFFAESLWLASLGCLLGLAVADAAIAVLKRTLPPETPHLAAVSLDWRVAACSAAVAAVAAVVFGGLPAWQFAANGQMIALKSGGRGTTDYGQTVVRYGLVVIEVALSLVLLVTAALLASSFFRMRNQPTGFNSAHVYSFSVPFGWDSDPVLLNSFASGALARLTTSPGVIAAGVVDQLPLHGGSQSGHLLVQGVDLDALAAEKEFSWRTASAGYFGAAGVPLKAGRLYRDWAGGNGEREVVITDRLSAILFPSGDAVGHSIAEARRGKDVAKVQQWFRVVGVVGSVRLNPSDLATEAGVYLPWGATYWPEMNFLVRGTFSIADFSRLVRNHVQPLTNAQIMEKIGTMDELTAETRRSERVRTVMLAAFSAAALVLSAIGLFGTLLQEVMRRSQEYGVRLALGAQPGSIAWSAVKSALLLAITGVVVGVFVSGWTSQLLRGMLFGIEASDLRIYVSAAAVLLGTAVLAALIPAMKASRIEPIQALRHE